MQPYPHLTPLKQIVCTWKENATSEQKSLACFLKVVTLLQKHYDYHLNSKKTDFKDPSENGIAQSQDDFTNIINWVTNTLTEDEKDRNSLRECLWREVGKYQSFIFRDVSRKKIAVVKSFEPKVEDLMSDIKMQDNEDSDHSLNDDDEDDDDEDDEDEESDQDEGDEGDDEDEDL